MSSRVRAQSRASRSGRGTRTSRSGSQALSVTSAPNDSDGDDTDGMFVMAGRGRGGVCARFSCDMPAQFEIPRQVLETGTSVPGRVCKSCYYWIRRHFHLSNANSHKRCTATFCTGRCARLIREFADHGINLRGCATATVDVGGYDDGNESEKSEGGDETSVDSDGGDTPEVQEQARAGSGRGNGAPAALRAARTTSAGTADRPDAPSKGTGRSQSANGASAGRDSKGGDAASLASHGNSVSAAPSVNRAPSPPAQRGAQGRAGRLPPGRVEREGVRGHGSGFAPTGVMAVPQNFIELVNSRDALQGTHHGAISIGHAPQFQHLHQRITGSLIQPLRPPAQDFQPPPFNGRVMSLAMAPAPSRRARAPATTGVRAPRTKAPRPTPRTPDCVHAGELTTLDVVKEPADPAVDPVVARCQLCHQRFKICALCGKSVPAQKFAAHRRTHTGKSPPTKARTAVASPGQDGASGGRNRLRRRKTKRAGPTPGLVHIFGKVNIGGQRAMIPAVRNTNAIAASCTEDDGAVRVMELMRHTNNLQALDLSGNDIRAAGSSAIAQSLRFTTRLTYLNLANNSLGPDGLKRIALRLRHTTLLRHVNLSMNGIGGQGLPGLTIILKHAPNLETLDLSCNDLGPDASQQLTRGLVMCTNLQSINLSHNDMGPSGGRTLAHALPVFTRLRLLNIGVNALGDAGSVPIAGQLGHLKHLTELDVSHNNIGPAGTAAFAKALPYCPSIASVNLSYDYAGEGATSQLVAALANCQRLTSLNVHANHCGALGMHAMAPSLQHLRGLMALDIGTNSIRGAGAVSLAPYLPGCRALTALNLESNELGYSGCQALASCLPECRQLAFVNFEHNAIDDDAFAILAPALSQCRKLRSLVLNRNPLGAHSMEVLGPLLAKMTGLNQLSLSGCTIGDGGLVSLCDELTDSTALSCLNVSNNGISAAGMHALADTMPLMARLESVHLGRNFIGDLGIRYLTAVLPNCMQLTELWLDANGITSAGATMLGEVVHRCRDLAYLHLGNNPIGDDGAGAIAPVLRLCPAMRQVVMAGCNITEAGIESLERGMAASSQAVTVLLDEMNLQEPLANASVNVWYPRKPVWSARTAATEDDPFAFVSTSRRLVAVDEVVDLPYIERLDPLDDLMDGALSDSSGMSSAMSDGDSEGSEVMTRAKTRAKARHKRTRRARAAQAASRRRQAQRETKKARVHEQRLATRKHCKEALMVVELAATWSDLGTVQEECRSRPHAINRIQGDGETMLSRAAKLGQLPIVKFLLCVPTVDVNACAVGGNTPLIRAAESGHLNITERLLAHGALHMANLDGDTPLCRSASLGHVKLSKFLVRSGGAVNSGNKLGQTPQMLAAASGHFALVEFFMHSANAKAVDKDNNSVLLWLCRNVGEDDTNTRKHVLALIRKGSDVNIRNTDGETPLLAAVANAKKARFISFLIKHGADPNTPNKDGTTPLLLAAQHGLGRHVGVLLRHKADVKAVDKNNDSVTTSCAASGTPATFSHLIEAGADPFHVNNDGMSALMLACWSGLFGIVETMRKRYARYGRIPAGHLNLQAKGSRNTALHFALENERWECARWLIKMGADPNIANVDGETPLLLATRATHFELVRRLVAAGADVNALSKAGESAMSIADDLYAFKIEGMLRAKGAVKRTKRRRIASVASSISVGGDSGADSDVAIAGSAGAGVAGSTGSAVSSAVQMSDAALLSTIHAH